MSHNTLNTLKEFKISGMCQKCQDSQLQKQKKRRPAGRRLAWPNFAAGTKTQTANSSRL